MADAGRGPAEARRVTLAADPARRRLLLAAVLAPLARARAAAPAPRVVSVGGALTEIVYRLNAQRFLVATDTTSTFPAEAQRLPKVGYQRSLSAEGLLALQPSLLLVTADAGPPAVLEQLSAAGVRTMRASGEHTFDAMAGNVTKIAAALGVASDGAALDRALRDEWQATQAAMRRPSTPPRVLFVLSHAANNVQVAGDGTAAGAMIALAGGVNAITGFQGYRPLSAEAAIGAAPDILLCTQEGVSALGGVDALLARPGLALTPAGRARRALSPDALFLLGFGPRLPAAVKELARGFGTLA